MKLPAAAKIMLLGEGGTGKSTYPRKLTRPETKVANKRGVDYDPTHGTMTSIVKVRTLDGDNQSSEILVEFVEVSGQSKGTSEFPEAFEGADGAIILWESGSKQTFRNVHGKWNQWLKENTKNNDIPIVVVANKVDDPEDQDDEYTESFRKQNKAYKGIKERLKNSIGHIHISLYRNRDVQEPLLLLLKKLSEDEDDQLTIEGVELMSTINSEHEKSSK